MRVVDGPEKRYDGEFSLNEDDELRTPIFSLVPHHLSISPCPAEFLNSLSKE